MKFYVLLSMLVILAGCSGYGGSGASGSTTPSTDSSIASVEITDATSLIITSDAVSISSFSFLSPGKLSSPQLQKITSDGKRRPVEHRNKEGEEIKNPPIPSLVKRISSTYVLIQYTNELTVLANSVTGAAYNLSDVTGSFSPDPDNIVNPGFDMDAAGNLYLVSNTGKLLKVDLSDAEKPSVSTYSAASDQGIHWFCVDDQGNAAYEASDSNNSRSLRFRKSSGGFEVLPGATGRFLTHCWKGLDGKMHYYNPSLSDLSQITHLLLLFDGTTFTTPEYGSTNMAIGCNFVRVTIPNKNRTVAVGCGGVFDLENPDNNFRTLIYSTFGLSDAKLVGASDNYYYVFGTDTSAQKVLLRIDPSDDSTTTVLTGQYDFYKMVVSPNGEITFNALRLFDGAVVLGKISSSNIVTILDEAMTSEVTLLERLN